MKIVYREFFSIRPDRLSKTIRGQKYFIDEFGNELPYGYAMNGNKVESVKSNSSSGNKLVRSFHNFKISINSQRNLRDKINYLYQFSNKRDITTYSGKKLKDFRVAFITLTLPMKQKTPTADVTRELFDPFLQSLRQYAKMNNYVWRLEFQKNGNVHYHLVTDSYVDYFYIKRRWNSVLEQHGYITDYANKMSALSWSDYQQIYKSNKYLSKQELYKRYNKGKQELWREPNSVDVKNATSSKLVSLYVSKYFSKSASSVLCNELDNEENSHSLRLCFWSRSLSRCKAESMPREYYSADVYAVLKCCKEAVYKVFDYCTVIYYDISELPISVRDWMLEYFTRERDLIGYIPAI